MQEAPEKVRKQPLPALLEDALFARSDMLSIYILCTKLLLSLNVSIPSQERREMVIRIFSRETEMTTHLREWPGPLMWMQKQFPISVLRCPARQTCFMVSVFQGSRRPARASLEASRQAPLPPTPMSTLQETLQDPSPPPPPAAELAGAPHQECDAQSAAADAQDLKTDEDESAEKAQQADVDVAEPILAVLPAAKHAAYEQVTIEDAGTMAADILTAVAAGAHVGTAGGDVRSTEEPERTVAGLRTGVVREDAAEVRQRSLDESGVIPGGRAAFGAPAPALQPRPATPGRGAAAAAPLPRAADCRGAVPGGRAAFGAPLPTAGAAATPASGWRMGGAERPTGAAAAIGRAPGGSLVRLLPQLHAQTAARRTAPADSRAFPRLVLRRLEAGAMPGDMLDCFDRLWHGSSVVESQS